VSLRERVSIVLLTYNCGGRLIPILDRITTLDVPIVAVDNASTDDTVAVLEKYEQVEVVRLERNIGAAGRNVGLRHTTTPYVAFCDDDGWYEQDGLAHAADLLDAYPRLGLVNARILVGPENTLDPISAIMEDSPLLERHGIPGKVLLGFMAGAVVVRRSAYEQAGGYEGRFFIGGEEETLAFKLARLGWQMRYVPEVVMHHEPSVANAPHLRAYGLRNTLWNCWLHRRLGSALYYTWQVVADHPKTADWRRGLAAALRGAPWVLRERDPMDPELDAQLGVLDRQRFADRRPFWNRHDPLAAYRDRERAL
jgi:GT2 family glycosyltransferase